MASGISSCSSTTANAAYSTHSYETWNMKHETRNQSSYVLRKICFVFYATCSMMMLIYYKVYCIIAIEF